MGHRRAHVTLVPTGTSGLAYEIHTMTGLACPRANPMGMARYAMERFDQGCGTALMPYMDGLTSDRPLIDRPNHEHWSIIRFRSRVVLDRGFPSDADDGSESRISCVRPARPMSSCRISCVRPARQTPSRRTGQRCFWPHPSELQLAGCTPVHRSERTLGNSDHPSIMSDHPSKRAVPIGNRPGSFPAAGQRALQPGCLILRADRTAPCRIRPPPDGMTDRDGAGGPESDIINDASRLIADGAVQSFWHAVPGPASLPAASSARTAARRLRRDAAATAPHVARESRCGRAWGVRDGGRLDAARSRPTDVDEGWTRATARRRRRRRRPPPQAGSRPADARARTNPSPPCEAAVRGRRARPGRRRRTPVAATWLAGPAHPCDDGQPPQHTMAGGAWRRRWWYANGMVVEGMGVVAIR
jgi:hypothetical protein